MENLKNRLGKGEALNGCWLNLGNPLTAEMVGRAGFDWVLIDLEHGSGDEKDALLQLQGVATSTARPIIRVESTDRRRIQKALDMGAEGMMVPQVRSAADAAIAIKGIYYPPTGERGVAKMVRTTGYGAYFDAYLKELPDRLLGVIQIETREALDHIDEIAALKGVDVLFIGPSDLSMSLGIFGRFDHPRYVEALQKITASARKAGKHTGILLMEPGTYTRYYDLGIRFFACGSDAGFVAQGARNMAAILNENRSKS